MDVLNKLQSRIITFFGNIIDMLPRLIVSLLILVIFLYIMKFVRKKLSGYMLTKADDPLSINFIDSLIQIINVILAIFLFLALMGQTWVATSFLGAASISAFVIGFAFKDIGENFLAGIILAFNRPFRLGDVVKSADIEGVIKEINLRDTLIKTFDGKDVYVPNGQILKNPLYNYTIDGFLRGNFSISVAKDADTSKARACMLDALTSLDGILTESKPPRTHIVKVTSTGIEIQAHYWLNTFDDRYSSLEVKSEAIRKCVEGLKGEGIRLAKDPFDFA